MFIICAAWGEPGVTKWPWNAPRRPRTRETPAGGSWGHRKHEDAELGNELVIDTVVTVVTRRPAWRAAENVRDMAAGMREFARAAKDDELLWYAAEVKLRAERRAGEMLDNEGFGQHGDLPPFFVPVAMLVLAR